MLLTKDEMAVEESALRKEERSYISRLSTINKRMKQIVANETSPDKAINSLYRYMNSNAFVRMIEKETVRMVGSVYADRNRAYRKAASKSKNGKSVFNSKWFENSDVNRVQKDVQKNAVQSAKNSFGYAIDTLDDYRRSQEKLGRRNSDIIREMTERIENVVGYRLRLLARFEIAKASNAFDKHFSEKVGNGLYVWACLHDERTRPSHKKMDGILCSWKEAPNPEALFGGYDTQHGYHPGGTYNCRCVAIPVIHSRDISLPVQYYRNGKITVIRNYLAFKIAEIRSR